MPWTFLHCHFSSLPLSHCPSFPCIMYWQSFRLQLLGEIIFGFVVDSAINMEWDLAVMVRSLVGIQHSSQPATSVVIKTATLATWVLIVISFWEDDTCTCPHPSNPRQSARTYSKGSQHLSFWSLPPWPVVQPMYRSQISAPYFHLHLCTSILLAWVRHLFCPPNRWNPRRKLFGMSGVAHCAASHPWPIQHGWTYRGRNPKVTGRNPIAPPKPAEQATKTLSQKGSLSLTLSQ